MKTKKLLAAVISAVLLCGAPAAYAAEAGDTSAVLGASDKQSGDNLPTGAALAVIPAAISAAALAAAGISLHKRRK